MKRNLYGTGLSGLGLVWGETGKRSGRRSERSTKNIASIIHLKGVIANDQGALRVPGADIHLEDHTIGLEERQNVRLKANGTPSVLSADITPTLERMGVRESEKAYYVVRLNTLRVAKTKADIEDLGGEVLTYLHDAAFVVRMNGDTVNQVAKLSTVEWIGPYKPEYKRSKSLNRYLEHLHEAGTQPVASVKDDASTSSSDSRRRLNPLPPRQAKGFRKKPIVSDTPTSSVLIEVNIYLFSDEGVNRVASKVKASGGEVVSAVTSRAFPKVQARIREGALDDLTLLPEVRLIERYVPNTLHNDEASAIINTDQIWSTLGYTGEDQIIGHADTGLDVGSMGSSIHDDFEGRIHAAFALGRPGDWSDPDGHGTHTAGSILGDGSKSGGTYSGSAPGAKLVHQSVMNSSGGLGGIPDDYGDIFQQAYDAGARIHSDSWGANTNGAYGDSQYLDAWLWNDGAPRDMLIIVSAGNEGDDSGTIGSPGTAKNCLTIGATENYRPAIGEDSDNIDDVAWFSSRGPTDDGRIKPDLVAPGTWIASTRTGGDLTSFEDDMESGTNGWTKSPADAPWTQVHDKSRSGTTSWKYTRSGSSDDYLITPAITLPDNGPMALCFWFQGSLGLK